LVSPTYCDDVRATITAANLPTRVQGLPSTADLITRMHADKKTIAGTLRIIAPTGKGTAQVITNPPLAALEAGWNAIR
jgi:3-dehydroquinate synthase